jgi:serine/threonine protein kinase
MSHDGTSILTLTNTQAKELAGRIVTINSEAYCFKNYDKQHPGQPPWRSGAEGKAYPLLDYDRAVAAYLKFFTRPTPKRLARTAWLIAQQLHTWLPGLAAAPLLWVDTRAGRRPASKLDFAGCLSRAVPGKTWLELKTSIQENSLPFSREFRWRCVRDLVLALAVLEQEGIVHGDLSPNNIVIDIDAPPDQPALYVIDFDAFVAATAGDNGAVAAAEGGTFGTEGYCPPDLAVAAGRGEGSVAPYSDRFGRDMLLFELLMMDCGLSPDDPPASWGGDQLKRRHAAWKARCDPDLLRTLPQLEPASLFALAEQDRPASKELAAGLSLSLPLRRQLRKATRTWSPVPAVLGHPLDAVHGELAARRSPTRTIPIPATLSYLVPWRWKRPAADPNYTTIWQDAKIALGCAAFVLLPGILAVIILFFRAIYTFWRPDP